VRINSALTLLALTDPHVRPFMDAHRGSTWQLEGRPKAHVGGPGGLPAGPATIPTSLGGGWGARGGAQEGHGGPVGQAGGVGAQQPDPVGGWGGV
jgi:hypothetical protein